MTTKHSLISYYTSSDSLNQLVAKYGDRLEQLDVVSKLQVVGVLITWQAYDTELAEQGEDAPEQPYTLAEAIEDYPIDISASALTALQLLSGIAPEDVIKSTIAISHQLLEAIA